MAQQSFLSEILARIAGAGRGRPQAAEDTANSLVSLCHSLLRDVSEAEGLKISRQILDIYAAADVAEKEAFFSAVSQEFGPDDAALTAAVADGNVYFEYITRVPGSLKMRSTVEIPEKLVQKWKFDISGIQH